MPGGFVTFHEIDLKTLPRSSPPFAEWDQDCGWVIDVFGKMLPHPDAALRLTEHFEKAGLPIPAIFCEAPIGNSADPSDCRWIADTVLTLKSKMIKFGLSNAVRLTNRLAGKVHEAASKLGAQLMGPAQICAWTRLS